eukprot:CAMPEP_0172878804 /NCGR_PEP_ID=MMETSP1075-20121228/110683_1 /TAXON_ID=2916 /ORGANISM="Ceratium fusus, Strain PA161109" /LENGTH=67 /DNA_ID=CAMNT_0013730677 /DNA_START=128 /DNA_END=328 /DNA_ORIENTATION=+
MSVSSLLPILLGAMVAVKASQGRCAIAWPQRELHLVREWVELMAGTRDGAAPWPVNMPMRLTSSRSV